MNSSSHRHGYSALQQQGINLLRRQDVEAALDQTTARVQRSVPTCVAVRASTSFARALSFALSH